jgi:hypothetical protein
MNVSAQRVVEVPSTVVAEQVSRTGSAPPPPAPPKQDVPILIVMAAPTPAPAAAEPAPTKLPTTASNVPLIGLLGVLFCALSVALVAIRTAAARIDSLKA